MNFDTYQQVVGRLAGEFGATGLPDHQYFQWAIARMNEIYSLPINRYPTLDHLNESPLDRIVKFAKTLQDEVDEGYEIAAALAVRLNVIESPTSAWSREDVHHVLVRAHAEVAGERVLDEKTQTKLVNVLHKAIHTPRHDDGTTELDRQILVMIADWLGDVNVYVRSEALKFGIPVEAVHAPIMGSNFTKLDENNEPIKNAMGKVEKGPNFVPPEAHIYATLFESASLSDQLEVETQKHTDSLMTAMLGFADPMGEVLDAQTDEDQEDEDDGADFDY